ncbi:MAG: DUF1570 domain-containing protein [Planctomycetaceae bacterium]|jgi:hypothetical protein|nr:DUF1570 domain-containing protein [Planctomycetaceae bacterium]MBT6484114.1 DUF1570 domain-containing protein [Planctomycetaceae bacterium]MBT6496425.1 DUF1570 domain-containing protein [Planctomycetaceae bacterium]
MTVLLRARTLITTLLVCGAIALVLWLPSTADAQSRQKRGERSERKLATSRKQHTEYQEKFSADVERLAVYCDGKNLPEAAEHLRKLAAPLTRELVRMGKLPSAVRPELSSDLSAEERAWKSQLRFLQKDHAKQLYLLSRRVLYAGSPSYAFDIVREVARHDPDHSTARRLLGYKRSRNEWITPFAAKMQKKYVWHETYGWLLKSHVENYEKGQRYFNGRWMTAAQETEFRRDFKFAWEVRTDHFLVKTNHSLERGVAVAKSLEEFYDNFFQIFAGFFNTPEQMEKLFSGRGSFQTSRNRPHEIHYYRTRDEYNQRLVKKIPQIAITNGLFFTTDRTCYFYHDDAESNDRTLFHEATHQLFYESSLRERPIAVEENFWIIEGIACYMESYSRTPGRLALGDPRYTRFHAARHRYLVDEYYVPLGRFASMGMRAFQMKERSILAKNYSQASGLAHFFMHYDDGRYRDALIRHLSQLYHPELRPVGYTESLADLTSTQFSDLDRQYGQYLKLLQKGLDELERGEEK